jgi:small subunit ribosomal protein S1
VVKEGDDVDFVVLATDSDERKFSLSRKAFLRNLQGDDLRHYIGEVAEPKTSLADAFSRANAAAGSSNEPT